MFRNLDSEHMSSDFIKYRKRVFLIMFFRANVNVEGPIQRAALDVGTSRARS